MGNVLCSHALAGVSSSKASFIFAQPQQQPCSNTKQPRWSCKAVSLHAAAGAAAVSVTDSRDEIEIALTQARAELDASAQKCFADDYATGKIIGHGAYCKVQVCTHNLTKQEFAVKAVLKAADDLKQREGDWGQDWCCLERGPMEGQTPPAARDIGPELAVVLVVLQLRICQIFVRDSWWGQASKLRMLAWPVPHLDTHFFPALWSCRHHQGGGHDAYAGKPPMCPAAACCVRGGHLLLPGKGIGSRDVSMLHSE